MEKIIKVVPCCKTRHWHPVYRIDIPVGIVRCELCDKLFDFEMLEIIQKGFSPATFFCDKCHKSALRELEEQRVIKRRKV